MPANIITVNGKEDEEATSLRLALIKLDKFLTEVIYGKEVER